MSEWNVKRAVRNVRQPYKTWVARTALVPYTIIMLPYAVVTEGGQWCKEVAHEISEAWREIEEW